MSVNAKMTAIADAIRAKTGDSEELTLDGMAVAIAAIETGGAELPEEAFTISGNCGYRFNNGGWDWFIENYGNKIITKDITMANNMFDSCKELKEIPFEINISPTIFPSDNTCANIFAYCSKLTSIPKINNAKAYSMNGMFRSCRRLREVPEDIGDWFDWSYVESQTSKYSGTKSGMFSDCNSLRSVPNSLLNRANPYNDYSSSYFYGGFDNCYFLDELVELPIPYTAAAWTSNAFSSSFSKCCRLKNLTFAMPNGQPYSMNWKGQTIDLGSYIGYMEATMIYNFTSYNHGIDADKEVKDAATYEALKDNKDWFTYNIAYSRYNHDSAVATINSLPDTSAYLATAGGTNTIKFRGDSGSATDGGAISALTEEEIAVAAARGWSVALV